MASRGRRRRVGGTCGVVVLLLSSACGLRVDPVATDVPVEASPSPPVVVASADPEPTASPAPAASAAPAVAQSEPTPTPAATTPAPVQHGERLWGRSFTSVSVQEDGQDRPLVAGTTVEVRFERRAQDEVVVWSAGCNGMGGVVRIDAERLTLTEDHGGTAMSCGREIDEQERWSRHFFRGAPRWHLEGRRLVLRVDATAIRLEETTA